MSRPILFVDFNGVLSYDSFWKSLRNKDHELHSYLPDIETYIFKEHSQILHDWMIGRYTSEEVHTFISQDLQISYLHLFETFVKDCEQMLISDAIIERLKLLKKDYILILATGNMDSFDRFTLPNHRYLYDIFDEIHNSYNLGLLKTTNQGEYFQRVFEQYNVEPHETYLIDDSGSTCRVFSYLGGISFRTKTEKEVLDTLAYNFIRSWR